jgi:phage baseplate assembly protein W
MLGMDRATGKRLSGDAHLAQSIGDILSTPIGSRAMRRDYGSMLFELVDGPMNALGRLRVVAAVADALRRWEPRFALKRVQLLGDAETFAAGAFILSLEGVRTDEPAPAGITRLSIPLNPVTV